MRFALCLVVPRSVLCVSAALVAATGCVDPTNPCDPAAPVDVARQGTRVTGRVVDQDGRALAGVVVSVGGVAVTAVSGDDGAFALADLPPSPGGYALQALPVAPDVGGSVRTAPLTCLAALDAGDLVVVHPRQPPEVELVRAVTDTSLLVAFGAGDAGDDVAGADVLAFYDDPATGFRNPVEIAADCRARSGAAARTWRVQVRPPFDTWHDAVTSAFPWIAGAVAVGDASIVDGDVPVAAPAGAFLDGDVLLDERVDDFCGAALCAQFSYLEPSLGDARARCANVVGYVHDGVVVGLEAFGSYEVRVLSETRVDDDVAARYALPALVSSGVTGGIGQTSLVPGALLPLVDNTGAAIDDRDIDVESVVATSGGRFAVVEPDGVRVLGGGDDVLPANGDTRELDGAPQGALATDSAADESAVQDFLDDGDTRARALSSLPAGDWVRIVKESDVRANIEKVFVGATAEAVQGDVAAERALVETAEARLPLSPSGTTLGPLRALSYLDPGDRSLADAAANPDDAYLMLYARGFVLVENGPTNDLALATFVDAADGQGSFTTDWADPVSSPDALPGSPLEPPTSGFGGRCASVVARDENDLDGAFGVVGAGADLQGVARTEVAVCYDWSAAHAEDVDFRDAEVLPGPNPLHLIADAANNRVVLLRASALAGQEGPLSSTTEEVAVGRQPVALTRSRSLDCSGAGADIDVVLVANAGSGDISVLADDGAGLSEIAVAELPEPPVAFVDDVEGPSCSAPFAWVIAVDGRLFPIDMRGAPSVPQCDGGPCAIASRGRAIAGAIAHRASNDPLAPSSSRAVVGGQGLVGELGFFRPAALPGNAFAFQESVTAAGGPEGP
jgi:hypothetical protein